MHGVPKHALRGAALQTSTGKMFFPLTPAVEDICIRDIARSLAMQCRFNGHVMFPYSVAQHSVIMSHNVAPEFAFEALMHDASEAYVGDMIRPIKYALPEFLVMEEGVNIAIAHCFGLPEKMSAEVKEADNAIIYYEKRDVVGGSQPWPGVEDPGWGIKIHPMRWDQAETLFLDRYKELTR